MRSSRKFWAAAGVVAVYVTGAAAAWSAPNIVHQPPFAAKPGEPVQLNATVTDPVSAVISVRLYYRVAGTLGYQYQDMLGSGYTYGGTIPKEAVTAAGVDYYLEARDQAGELATEPPLNASLAPYHLVVRAAAGAPALRLLLPEDGSVLPPEEATALVVAIDAGASRPDLSTLAVIVDEKNITAQCQISETLVTYAFPASPAEGLHGVRVTVRNLDGVEAASPTWSFTIRRAGAPAPSPTATPAAAFRINGGITAESQYAAMTQDSDLVPYPSQPRGWLNRLNLNLNGQAGNVGFLGAAYLTSEEQPGRQPVDRLHLEFFDPGFDLILGDQYPSFSPYSLDNLFVRGGGLTLFTGRPEQSRSLFQVLGGLTRLALPGRDPGAPGTYEQWLWAGRWRYDFLAGSGLGLNFVTVNDFGNSLARGTTGGTQPAANFALTGEGGAKVFWSERFHTLFFAEYGLSYYDEQMSAVTVSLAPALRGGMRWEWGGRSFVKVEYKNTGAKYVSLASPWLIGDWNGLAGDAQVFLADDALVFTGTGNYWHDNLAGQKNPDPLGSSSTATGTTTTLFLSGALNYRVVSWLPALTVGYSLSRQRNDAAPIPTVDNQTHVLNLGAGLQVPAGADQLLGNLSYAQTDFQNLTTPKFSPDIASSSFLLSVMYLLGPAWTWSAGFGLTGTETKTGGLAIPLPGSAAQRVNYTLGSLRANWKLLPGRVEAGAGWELLNGRDNLDLIQNSLTTLSLTGTYFFVPAQSLTLTLSSIGYTDQLRSEASYDQFVTSLRYNQSF